MFSHRSIAWLVLILFIKQVACKVTDNTDVDDEALVDGSQNLSLKRSYDEIFITQLSCARDHPSETITWSIEREGWSVGIWSSDHPDTTTNDDLWNVVMIDNQAILTIQGMRETSVYICSHGNIKEKMDIYGKVSKVDAKIEALLSRNDQSQCDEDTQFTCDSGTCIWAIWRCDGIRNCADGSDEYECFDDCTGWACNNGQCIMSNSRCNTVFECDDRSDEYDCFDQCSGFECKNGQCIREVYRCNGRALCDDGSDEDPELCDVWCMEPQRICDGWQHCEDNRDEEGCVCDETQLECPSGGCINPSERCNSRYACTDGSDEKGCVCNENTQWTCDSGYCIVAASRCDGMQYNCHDYSDEKGCGHEDPIWGRGWWGCNQFSEFYCNSGMCIPLAWKCDGIDDCAEGEDEDCVTDTTMREYTERPSTVDDIVNREATTQIPLGETGTTMMEYPERTTTVNDITTQIPLGETGSHIDNPLCPLPDCAFISSSDFFSCTGPDQARIDAEDAWVAHPDENLPFLQIDLFRDVTVESIVTRGNGFNDEWTTVYSVAYRRDGSSSWIQDPAFYFANVDPNTPFINHLSNGPVSARYWRIYPLSFVGQRALRVDLLGPLDNCQADFTCASDKSHRLPLIANPECPLPLSQITSSSTLVRCSNAIQAVLPMVAGTCDTEELTPVQSPRLCNSWIPRADDTDSFIQFDLGQSTEVFEIITQGRGELINEFVNSYRVSYSEDGDNFNFIIDHILDQPQIFPGNTDSFNLVSNRVTTLPNPEGGRVARYWRIHPVGFVGRPGLKVELLGVRECP